MQIKSLEEGGESDCICQMPAMRSTQRFSITLSNEMADVAKAKVAVGEYTTESEVIRDGLRAMRARDRVGGGLRDQAVPAAEALKADSGRALSAYQVREHLATKRRSRAGASKA